MLGIPHNATEITPQWLTAALRSTGVLGKEAVISCLAEPIGQEFGFASSIARIRVKFDSRRTTAPSSLIAKMSTNSADQGRSETLCEKYRREARFYEQIAPEVDIRIPRCFYVAHDPETASIILLLEDLGRGRFGDADKGWELKDAELVVETLARLHARWWDDPRLEEFDWLPTFGTNTAQQLQRLVERRDTFLERHGSIVPPEIIQMIQRFGPQHETSLNRLQGPPRTLLHVDTHLDNLVFLDRNKANELVIFDWQGVARGLCVVDLALFLLGGSVERRRKHEAQLLERYHAALLGQGVTGYSFRQLLENYRVAILRWWVGTINGLGSSYAATWIGRQADVARHSVVRWCAAVSDHQLTDFV